MQQQFYTCTSIEKREVLSAKVYNWLAGCWIETKERKPMYHQLYYSYSICRERETHHNFWRIKYRSNLDARSEATTTFLSYILIYIGSFSLSLSRSLISSSIRICSDCSHVRLYKCFSTDFFFFFSFGSLAVEERRGQNETQARKLNDSTLFFC